MNWPFKDPPNVAVITTRTVLAGEEWVGLVSHDEDDGAWQCLPLEGACAEEDGRVVCLHEMLQIEPAIAELADLALGWEAWRETKSTNWHRRKQA